MALEFEAEEVLDFALLPVGGGHGVGEGGEQRLVRRHGHAENEKAVRGVEGEDVVEVKNAVLCAGIIAKEADQEAIPFLVKLRAEAGDQLHLGMMPAHRTAFFTST